MKERSALAGSLIAAFLASACCIGPLLLGAVGLGSLGFASALAPLRPWFLAEVRWSSSDAKVDRLLAAVEKAGYQATVAGH